MNKILIKNVFHKDRITDILIEGNRFTQIAPNIDMPEAKLLDGTGKAILPPFYNAHTHAAMTLLRGYADDMPLFKWLNEYIWPYEARMNADDVYAGSRLAILEMIKSGCIFFNDMYWNIERTIRATEEMGIRAAIGVTFTDRMGEEGIEANFRFLEEWEAPSSRIQLTIAPRAIYTVSEALWLRCAQTARDKKLKLHIHLSETKQEVNDCIRQHGLSPVRYLDSIGVLGDNVVAAHVVHVDEKEIEILKERKVTIIHNPCSNMKLSSGLFLSDEIIKAGCRVALGTDGCSSNNNLDMREEMKFASLLAKHQYNPETLPADEVFLWATQNGAQTFDIEAGLIAENQLADALLIDLNNERMVPNHHLISNWVYSADNRCIDTVICDGKILMQNGHVDKEEEIIEEAKKVSRKQ